MIQNGMNSFPLYKDDGIIAMHLPQSYKDHVHELKEAISAGKLKLEKNYCLCHNPYPERDIVISEKDRYGLPIPQLLCSRCGLVRSGLVFDMESNTLFYKDYYRKIYNIKKNVSVAKIFKAHKEAANQLYNNVRKHIDMGVINNVVEIGCSCGFNLYPFYLGGAKVVGYDYNEEFLRYGQSKGLDLRFGDFCENSDSSSYDLIILNHVFEHLLDPIGELNKILIKLRKDGYLYIEVPGIYSLKGIWGSPLLYFQNAHVYYYYGDYLKKLFSSFGLDIIHSNERCTFICKKVRDDKIDVHFDFDPVFSPYVERNALYFLECESEWQRSWYKRHLRKRLYKMACLFGWKKIRPLFRR